MKLKTSAIAMAVAGTLAVPMTTVVHADGHTKSELYISARAGIESVSSDDDAIENLEFGDLASRWGIRGETDLGNGMSAFGSAEWAVNGGALRQLHVGLSGDFGSVKIGENTYAAYYNHVAGPIDKPYWVAFPGIIENGRTGNVINYEGSAGAVRFGLGVGADGSDTSTTSTQFAVSVDIGDSMTLAIGSDDDDNANEEATTGITLSGSAGDIAYVAHYATEDENPALADDITGLQLWVGFGAFWVSYGSVDLDDADATPTVISAGMEMPIGPQTRWWLEVSSEDWDDVREDETNIVGALRYDF